MPELRHADARMYFVFLATRLLGHHLYAWGGESDDEGGFDCSGLVSDCLIRTARAETWSQLYRGGRATASGLEAYYAGRGVEPITRAADLIPGALVFYVAAGAAPHHVAIHVATVPSMRYPSRPGEPLPFGPMAIEAAGAGSGATSPRAALLRSAGVRLSASDEHGGAAWRARDPFRLLDEDMMGAA